MRFNIPERATELREEFAPYVDHAKPGLPFKPGTPDAIKKKKEEWKKIMDPLIKKMDELTSS